MIYVGNGANDIPAAKAVKTGGGEVGVVSNSLDDLHEWATAIAASTRLRGRG